MKSILPAAPSRRAALATAGRLLACGLPGVYQTLTAQPRKPRLNPLIAKLEQGKAVLTPNDWAFIDMEHGPYLVDRLQQTLNDLGSKRNADGVLETAPIV